MLGFNFLGVWNVYVKTIDGHIRTRRRGNEIAVVIVTICNSERTLGIL